jgi:prefoldin alpha subunit
MLNEEKMKALNFQLLNQNLMSLKNQLNTIDLQIADLTNLKMGLFELKDIKDTKTFVPFGNGLFLEATLKQPENVLMNVGSNVLVKKNIEATDKILKKQIFDLNSIHSQLNNEIEKMENALFGF